MYMTGVEARQYKDDKILQRDNFILSGPRCSWSYRGMSVQRRRDLLMGRHIITSYGSIADPGCSQCCGSRIRLFSFPDTNCLHPGSRIRIKEFKYFNQKKWFLSSRKYDPGCSCRIRMLTSCCCWLLNSNGPCRTSQEFSGSGCGTATSWYSISILFRRVAPGSICVFGMHFWNCALSLHFLFHLAPSSMLRLLCLRRNSFSSLVTSTHPGSRGQKGTGSRIWIRNTGWLLSFF
jgi:hypothetical protein